jgi:hypothetical protein
VRSAVVALDDRTTRRGQFGARVLADPFTVRPEPNLRFTQGYLEALAAVDAAGGERRLLAGALEHRAVPAPRIASRDLTDATEH